MRSFILAISSAAVLAIVFAFILNSLQQPADVAFHTESVRLETAAPIEASEYWPPLFGYRLKVTDTLLVFVTLLLFLATAALWGATRRLVQGAEKTAERQLRAYMCLYGGSIRLIQVGGQDFIEGYVTLKNFGQTPAYDHSCWVRIDVRPASHPPFDVLATGLTKAIVAPDGEANLPVHWGPVSAQDLADIRSEAKRIFVWGGADYIDAFRRVRFFKFYYWNAKEIPGKGWGLLPSDKQDEAN
jgi:hypothetical protein